MVITVVMAGAMGVEGVNKGVVEGTAVVVKVVGTEEVVVFNVVVVVVMIGSTTNEAVVVSDKPLSSKTVKRIG